jgi:hypothetical protein
MLSFSEALEHLKQGDSVLRYSHNVELKEIVHIKEHDIEGLFVISYDDKMVPYTPDYFDLISEDWYVVGKTFATRKVAK